MEKNGISPLTLICSEKHCGGCSKFWQVYSHCNNCTRCLWTVTDPFLHYIPPQLHFYTVSNWISPFFLCPIILNHTAWLCVTCKCEKVCPLQFCDMCRSWIAWNTTSWEVFLSYIFVISSLMWFHYACFTFGIWFQFQGKCEWTWCYFVGQGKQREQIHIKYRELNVRPIVWRVFKMMFLFCFFNIWDIMLHTHLKERLNNFTSTCRSYALHVHQNKPAVCTSPL